MKLAQHIGPIARCRLGDSPAALQIWEGAAKAIKNPALKAECQISAADILINDLVKATRRQNAARTRRPPRLGKGKIGPTGRGFTTGMGRLLRRHGRRQGRPRLHTRRPNKLAAPGRNFIESTAWKGAHSRSAEEFIKIEPIRSGGRRTASLATRISRRKNRRIFDAAVRPLLGRPGQVRPGHRPGRTTPGRKSRFGLCRSDFVSGRRLRIAPRPHEDRAVATLHSILKDYPGSPLVPAVQEKIGGVEEEVSFN